LALENVDKLAQELLEILVAGRVAFGNFFEGLNGRN
jgi:hypothetical protein